MALPARARYARCMRSISFVRPLGLCAGLLSSGCFATGPHETDPKSVALYDVANDHFRKSELRASLAKVNEALEADERNADAAHLGALIHLAFCAKDTKSSDCRFADAERLAKLALDANPDFREARNTLGVVLIHEKKFDDAIEVLKPLAEDILYGSPQVAWGNLGWAYLEKGAQDEAIDALRRAVAAQPTFCVGNFRLGVAYEKKGQSKAAIEAFARAVETERPGCQRLQEAWEGKGRVAARLGLHDLARQAYGQCVELSKSTASGERCQGGLHKLPAGEGAPSKTAGLTPASGT